MIRFVAYAKMQSTQT